MGIARTIIYCLKLRHNDKLSTERIQAVQLLNLRKAVSYAKAKSPFYSELYRDVDPDDPGFSVESLPPVTKDILMENFDRVVTDPRIKLNEVKEWARDRDKLGKLFKRRFVVTHTSGTTGMPAYFVYNKREWDWIQAIGITRGMRFKPSFIDFFRYAGRILVKRVRIALVSVTGGHFVTYLLFLVTPKLAKKLSKFEYLSVVKPLPELVQSLNKIDPNLLHCYPTMLEVLAYEQKAGRLNISPWIISSSSEPLTQAARKTIEDAFPNTPVHETYGTTEGVTLASECSLHRGMHVNSDYYVVESVSDDGSPVEPGRAGDKVYLSCLFTRCMPILRYELTDVTIPLPEKCECGLPFPLIKVRGRTDDIFWVHDKDKNPVALPPIPFEAMLLDIDGLRQYQLVQQERNHFNVFFRPNDGVDVGQVRQQIQSKFMEFFEEKQLIGCVQIDIKEVDQIERDPTSGKIRQIYSKVERLYLPGMPLGDRRSGEDRRTGMEKEVEGERRQRPRRDKGDSEAEE
ncbi:MAG: phenylacetate--CoA ligase family protein [Deltaproteobacteria bacterium]|nr:phenylacetate--CoA ligase family protein [Deltaproteobacteria bacterium]